MVRFYQTGKEFLDDNADIIREYPMDMAFFEGNARSMPNMQEGFAVKVSDKSGYLLATRYREFPMVLFGAESLCSELAECLFEQGQDFGRVLATKQTAETFLAAYEALAGGSHTVKHAMTTMCCTSFQESETADVSMAALTEVEEIAKAVLHFQIEAMREKPQLEQVIAEVKHEIAHYAFIRRDGCIVSIAKSCRETEKLCAVSYVYTVPKYRRQGLARQIVTALTRDILKKEKLPYLYVDQENPISNHLYQSIGYSYKAPQFEIEYFPR